MEIERRLSDVLSEFARTLVTEFSIQTILDRLVVRIVHVLPVSAAGVTLISPGMRPQYVAASDRLALRFEELQTELGEGPCVAAYETGEAVAVANLRTDDRFPTFTPRALEEGLMAVFTFPLRRGDDQLGALDLYRTTAGPLNARAMAAAQTLADVASAYLLNAQARADLQESSESALRRAHHDGLTGLPNRALLVQRLDHAILRSSRSEKMVAIMFADLDRFKSINDTHGHHIGDQLLVAVAQRLTGILRPGDTLARHAGDEFVILCEDLDDAKHVEPLARRINAALAKPFVLSGAEIRITASIGIAFAGRGSNIPEDILRDADMAMYQIKGQGGGRHGIIDLREQHLTESRSALDRDLRGALSRGELWTEYQPIVATADGIAGVEALLRWAHPNVGLVPPETAVAVAERSGLITDIGRWVLQQACTDRHRWQQYGPPDGLLTAVNVSPHQLTAPDFATTVAAILAANHTDPKLLSLEMTESVFIRDGERARIVLHDLKDIGVMLALDDFGTGYSSLNYLKQFPIDIVKIDRVFIADLDRDPTSRAIVSAVVALAHGLHMTVVAEGVETAEQHAQVKALDCDSYQGFYFAPPESADDLSTLLAGGGCSTLQPLANTPAIA